MGSSRPPTDARRRDTARSVLQTPSVSNSHASMIFCHNDRPKAPTTSAWPDPELSKIRPGTQLDAKRPQDLRSRDFGGGDYVRDESQHQPLRQETATILHSKFHDDMGERQLPRFADLSETYQDYSQYKPPSPPLPAFRIKGTEGMNSFISDLPIFMS